MDISSRGRVIKLDGLVLTLLFASLAGNVYLGVARTRAVPSVTGPQLVALGSRAPQFRGTNRAGETVQLDYARSGKTTLLYVFSPTCHWCERNLANIKAVVAGRPDLNIVGVNIGPKLDDTTVQGLPFATILRRDSATVGAYRFAGTPATILVSPDGRVLQAWAGAYAGKTASDVSKALAVNLPGLIRD